MTCTLSWSPHASIPKRVSVKGNLTNRKANLEGPTPEMQHMSDAAPRHPWLALGPVTPIVIFVLCWFSALLLALNLGKALAVLLLRYLVSPICNIRIQMDFQAAGYPSWLPISGGFGNISKVTETSAKKVAYQNSLQFLPGTDSKQKDRELACDVTAPPGEWEAGKANYGWGRGES